MPNPVFHALCRLLPAASVMAGLLVLATPDARAWGYEGHAQVGRVALSRIDNEARAYLTGILGDDLVQVSDQACNWPDVVRKTPEWEWSAPQHYVNIPHAYAQYDRERDCPNGLCVTESIKKYADQLSNPRLDREQHWQAYAWLCHLVGDLHQPLHTGYKDDRGANYVDIMFIGEESNLHTFWDSLLIRDRIPTVDEWPTVSSGEITGNPGNTWNPLETDAWTSESHMLVAQVAYPGTVEIHPEFADRSWQVIQDQVEKAGYRLARILNATVGEGEVLLDR